MYSCLTVELTSLNLHRCFVPSLRCICTGANFYRSQSSSLVHADIRRWGAEDHFSEIPSPDRSLPKRSRTISDSVYAFDWENRKITFSGFSKATTLVQNVILHNTRWRFEIKQFLPKKSYQFLSVNEWWVRRCRWTEKIWNAIWRGFKMIHYCQHVNA